MPNVTVSKFGYEFPSPIGELHFSMLSRLNVVRLKMIRFRPLSGSYISQLALDNGTRLVCSDCFRPLSGSYISQCYHKFYQIHNRSFRPLSGSYSSHFTECHGSKSGMAVSVPYRGATFLNGEPMFTLTGQDRFPSPIGELHFSIQRSVLSMSCQSPFPSPIGELHFSMNRR